MSKLKLSLLLVFLILIFDQIVKVWIKTHMMIGEEIHIAGDWFIIHFTENEGMAFGWKLGGDYGKLVLSLFRIFAVGAIGWYIVDLAKRNASTGFIVCMSMIFAGALGNILDSAFYGLVFNESYYQVASMFPKEGGYASFLHGRVVDMLYFPVLKGHFPSWSPIWATEEFIFFRPVFNIADTSITAGVIAILVFQRRFFKSSEKQELDNETETTATETINE